VATNTPLPTATPGGGTGGCAGAVTIPAAGGVFTGTTSGASTLAGTCASSNNAPEQVFAWTPAASGQAQISTCSATATSYDTVVYVRSGSCTSGAQIACNDDTTGCLTSEPNDHHGSRLTANVTAGQTYYIVVDGYATSHGAFTLTVVAP